MAHFHPMWHELDVGSRRSRKRAVDWDLYVGRCPEPVASLVGSSSRKSYRIVLWLPMNRPTGFFPLEVAKERAIAMVSEWFRLAREPSQ